MRKGQEQMAPRNDSRMTSTDGNRLSLAQVKTHKLEIQLSTQIEGVARAPRQQRPGETGTPTLGCECQSMVPLQRTVWQDFFAHTQLREEINVTGKEHKKAKQERNTSD